MKPPDELLERAGRLLGASPVSWVRATGGYTITQRWSLDLDDGRRVFVKLAPTDALAEMIRTEYANMSRFDEDLRCEIVAWDDGHRPMLVLEDLRDAHWPPEWRPGDVDRARDALERMWSLPADDLAAPTNFEHVLSRWREIEADPAGFLSLGIVTEEWLAQCLPTLREAEDEAVVEGDAFVHGDIRSDNMCFAGDRVVIVDWNWAVRANPALDLTCWAPSLRLEGGPLPEEIAPGLGAYAAGVAGYFGAGAPLPPPEGAPTVRKFQLRQLRIALPWACRELGLPQPDRRWAMDEITQINADLEAGRITESEWYVRGEETLIDAYLSVADPRAQSGKSGDETEWRWSRELILDAFPEGRATFLDVGCANGYLMESVVRWGAERGIEVEPFGVDLSWRIAALARCRLPQYADNIFVGNAIDWEPPRTFDVVQIGIDEVPKPRRRELVDRVLASFVAPGGALVFRADRAGRETEPVKQLDEIGLRPDAVLERPHPVTGELRRTAVLRRPLR